MLESSGGGVGHHAERLEGSSNYQSWKFDVKCTLMHDDLWKYVETTPCEFDLAGLRGDQKAFSKICHLVSKYCKVHVRSCKTAKEAWEALRTAFEDKGLNSRRRLLLKLMSLKPNQFNSIGAYVNEVLNVAHQIGDLGKSIDDELLAAMMLAGLPEEYAQMRLALENSNVTLTTDYIKTKLLQMSDYTESSSSNDAETALAANKQICEGLHKMVECPDNPCNKKQQGAHVANAFWSTTQYAMTPLKKECILDSGASTHMCTSSSLLKDFVKHEDIEVSCANGGVEVERIKSEAEQLLYADHEVKEEMVIGPTEIQRPNQTPGADSAVSCARGGECSAELRAVPTPHNNDLSHNQTTLEPCQCQSSTDTCRKQCHSGDKAFVCHYCHKIYQKRRYLIQHLQSHISHITQKQRLFSCKTCNKKFTSVLYLTRHERIHSVKQFSCEFCDKRYSIKQDLVRHTMIHSGLKPFSCDVCDKKFNRSDLLFQHKIVHSREKRFACYICKKSFSCKGNLERHSLIHSGLKPYSCDVCKKKFNCPSNLVKHKKIHSGDKPFVCDICDKSYKNKRYLVVHLRRHGRFKPFSCDVCDKKFNQSGNLSQHKKSHSK